MFAPAVAPIRAAVPLAASTPRPLRHRGFTVEVRPDRRGGTVWGYAVLHEGLLLHAERAAYRTATAAERAARSLVDDALASFDHATREGDFLLV